MPRRLRDRFLCALFVAAAFLACSSRYGDSVTDGAKTGRCFPNGTCNDGLVCVQDVCLEPSSDASASTLDAQASVEKDATADAPKDSDAAPPDAGPDCTRKQLGDVCTSATDCCSDACGEALKCVAGCTKLNASCGANGGAECCAGTWCGSPVTGISQCMSCVPKNGEMGTNPQGMPVEASCCSRSGNLLTNKCD